ncbi:MAG: PilX N-terminal domain-containing pilus assembly protein [Pseudomonadales bacterium]|nr:PilX N-terminal domain-containing pilus assembly protein [Pseudomonadales bacterium]
MMKPINQQKGAVLAVSLMFLLMASLIAIAAMDDSILQERMATNEQNINRAFQAAESAIDDHIETVTDGGDLSLFTTARLEGDKDDPSWPSSSFDSGTTAIATTLSVEYKGEVALSSGNSLDADESTVRMTGARFEYIANSSITDTGANVNVVQGIEYR